MIEQLGDLPSGVLGFRASGKITRDEYRRMLEPIRAALERGEKVSLLFVTAEGFSGLDLPALWEDLKVAGTVGLKHRSAWVRFALVTDKGWIRYAVAGFGWLSPGELRLFEPDELEQAKAWLSEPA